ncbi:unnamed protein product [Spirodela intermedia]|uniref:methylated diphthine methylhydrolase n=1 Tax=Spirodela intermedia TaxID=51605 RepID=A0A7I8JUE7_SPIIN|nr:unnamed protein product [Spirodela intermedia]CAA6673082.1 unnamed protein product [Spirodela intermedia]
MDASCFRLDNNADAVEFCPHNTFHHILAAATYTLQESSQPDRSGSLSLFAVDDNLGLKLIHQIGTVGIFDIKWNPSLDKVDPLLAVADAHGCLSIHSLKPGLDSEDHGVILNEVFKENVSDSMCLCLDWNPSATSISIGLSNGSASVISIREDKVQASESWQAHEYEVWAACFDAHRPQLLFTGSDDCCLSCWDLRLSLQTHSSSNPHTLLTGSYDEFLRVWDLRATSRPLSQGSVCLGGGVWRLKPHPDVSDLILAACMHNGFAIVKLTEQQSPVVVETYQKHESLAYGADWRKGRSNPAVVATCSFYDKLVRVWTPASCCT